MLRSVKGYKTIAYSGNASSDNSDPKRIESSINFVPVKPRADGDHVLLNVVLNF